MPKTKQPPAPKRPPSRRRAALAEVEQPAPVESAWVLTREMLVAEGDTWLRTPWVHQQSMKGVGADCLGFLRGIARFSRVSDEPFREYLAYLRRTDDRQEEQGLRMVRLLEENMNKLDDRFAALPGDWFVFKDELTGLPQHVAMVRKVEGGIFQVIHATEKHGVAFNRLDRRAMRRIHSAYRVPGVVG